MSPHDELELDETLEQQDAADEAQPDVANDDSDDDESAMLEDTATIDREP